MRNFAKNYFLTKKPFLTYENQKAILESMPRFQTTSEQMLDDGRGFGAGWWSHPDVLSGI